MANHSNKISLLNAASVSLYDPQISTTVLVCPHCLVPVVTYAFAAKDGVLIETHTCATHGEVIALRSAVANKIPPYGPRTGTHPMAVYTPDRNAEIRRFAAKLAQPIISRPMECYA